MTLDWKSVGSAIGSAAPILGTLLGGPAGGAVGALVASALGTTNDPASVTAALSADPAALEKLQELQINSKVQLQQLTVQAESNRLQAEAVQYGAEVADRDSARQLAAKQPGDLVRPTITFILLFGGIAIVLCVFGGFAKDIMKDSTASLTIGTVIGLWFGEIKQTLGFYFGMTKDASEQNMDMAKFAHAAGSVTFDNNTQKVIPDAK